jgi:hypothetical protein
MEWIIPGMDSSTSYDLDGSDSGNFTFSFDVQNREFKIKMGVKTENNVGFDFGFLSQTITVPLIILSKIDRYFNTTTIPWSNWRRWRNMV